MSNLEEFELVLGALIPGITDKPMVAKATMHRWEQCKRNVDKVPVYLGKVWVGDVQISGQSETTVFMELCK